MHAKLSSSPPRSSPVRLGPSYVLKKGKLGKPTGAGRSALSGAVLHPRQGSGSGLSSLAPGKEGSGDNQGGLSSRKGAVAGLGWGLVEGREAVDAGAPPAAQMLASSRRKKELRYRSVISDIFDGSILSLVQCLTCDRVRVLSAASRAKTARRRLFSAAALWGRGARPSLGAAVSDCPARRCRFCVRGRRSVFRLGSVAWRSTGVLPVPSAGGWSELVGAWTQVPPTWAG